MAETLLSLGLDVGTTSTQMIFSELVIENRAGSFSVPDLAITERRVLYRSPVYFTPLQSRDRVDAAALRELVDREFARAHIPRERVDTGAIIITGETSRKENARAVLTELSGYAGEFVVATAGPDLESRLAARGSGAVRRSRETGERILHMDIGGGTSNLALIEAGKILATGCLNVGGRLLKLDGSGIVTYVSPVLEGLCPLNVGDRATPEQVQTLAETLTRALEMAAGRREPDALLARLTTPGTAMEPPREPVVLSFSGGVADCIAGEHPWLAFGDMGPILGRTIRESRLCREGYLLGQETIRATVIGAGCHSARLSGSTVYHRGVTFPLKNLPVVCLTREEQSAPDLPRILREKAAGQDGVWVLALPGQSSPEYRCLTTLAEQLLAGCPEGPLLLCVEQDMALALGQALAVRTAPDRPILCIDRVSLEEESYLDVGAPLGPVLPVIVKTLVLNQ